MNKLLKSKVCGSRILFTRLTKLIKEGWKVNKQWPLFMNSSRCLPKSVCSNKEKKKKKERQNVKARHGRKIIRIQTLTLCRLDKLKSIICFKFYIVLFWDWCGKNFYYFLNNRPFISFSSSRVLQINQPIRQH